MTLDLRDTANSTFHALAAYNIILLIVLTQSSAGERPPTTPAGVLCANF